MMTPNDLLELDRTFCRAVQVGGAKSWASYFSPIGAMIMKTGNNLIGREAIYHLMQSFFSKSTNRLTWQPEFAQVSEDFTLGYTFGSYLRTTLNEENNEVSEIGRYTTIWRLQPNGQYQIELDIGN